MIKVQIEENKKKMIAVDIYEDDEYSRTKYFTDYKTAKKWVDQYNYDSDIGDSASDPEVVYVDVDKNGKVIEESLNKANPNDWRYKVLVDAGCDMHNAKMLDEFTFCDVEGLTHIKDNGYKYIETNSSDYTAGLFTNGKYVISRIAGGYASVYKLGPKAKKKLASGEIFDIHNDSLEEGIKVEMKDNSKYINYLKRASKGINISKIYNQPNTGTTVDIYPSKIEKAIKNLNSMGFTKVDEYRSHATGDHDSDNYYVFINGKDKAVEDRVVIGIVFDPSETWAFMNAKYDDIEDSEYFE